MPVVNERKLFAEIEAMIDRRYGRLLNRFFRGVLTAVSGSSGNYKVQLRREGEAAGDGNTYQVAPTFSGTPAIGDKVECIWRDQATAYVLFKAPN